MTARNAGSSGAPAANSVMDERSFIASTPPKMSVADRPSVPASMRAHSASRGPSTGCARYACASAMEVIAYRFDIALNPRPAICGKTNHIQCPRLAPARSSATARR
jgi:hypothetical protein